MGREIDSGAAPAGGDGYYGWADVYEMTGSSRCAKPVYVFRSTGASEAEALAAACLKARMALTLLSIEAKVPSKPGP